MQDDLTPEGEEQRRARDKWWADLGYVTLHAAALAEGVTEATIENRHRRGLSTWVRIGRELVTTKQQYSAELNAQIEQRRSELAARPTKAPAAKFKEPLL